MPRISLSGLPWANSTTEKSNSRRQTKSMRGALVQRLVGRGGDRRADEGDLDARVALLDHLGGALVAVPAHGAGEEDEELVVLQDVNDILPVEVVGRSVDQAGTLKHAGGIGEPDRVPVGLDLAGCGPAAAGAAIELFKGGGVEEQCLQRRCHSFHFTIYSLESELF